MSLMVGPVSRLSFGNGGQTAAPVNNEDIFGRAGAFTTQDDPKAAEEKAPKKHSALKTVLGTVAALAVVAFGLYAASKWGGKTFDATRSFEEFSAEGVKTMDKVKGYVTTAIGKAGKWVGDNCQKVADAVTGLFKHGEAAPKAE